MIFGCRSAQQNIETVNKRVAKSAGISFRHDGHELDISRRSLQLILTKDCNFMQRL